MFPNEFIIYKENEDHLEFRYNRKLLLVRFVLCTFLFLILLVNAKDDMIELFYIFLGTFFLLVGIVPVLTNRRIILDKNRKFVSMTVGAWPVVFKSEAIRFSQIGYVEIKESPTGVSTAMIKDMKDTIYFSLKKGGKVKIAISKSDLYSNEFTYKLSEAIGCRVVVAR